MWGYGKKKNYIIWNGALSKLLTEYCKDSVEIIAYLLNEAGDEINGKPIISLSQLQNIGI